MAGRGGGRPTDVELEILKVLWELGPSTVRDVMDEMAKRRRVGYTTVLKMLQIMREKRLVVCDAKRRPHVFRARHSQSKTLKQLAGDLLERAFDGSTRQLLLHALEHKRAKPQELEEIRRLLDELERGEK